MAALLRGGSGARARVVQASSRLRPPAASESASVCNNEVQILYEQIIGSIAKKRIPSNSMIYTLFESCRTNKDVILAFEMLKRYRIFKCSVIHLYKDFPMKISKGIISACLQTRAYDLGLKTLWKHNNYGLSPSVASAHQLLSHARMQNDITFMNAILKTMVKNTLMPTTTTAKMTFRICKHRNDTAMLLKLHKFFVDNGVKLTPVLYDICISSAANSGKFKDVWQIQKRREKNHMTHTTASAFSCAKALVFEGKSQAAADLVFLNCQDKKKRDKYLRMTVRKWPLEVLSKLKQNSKKASTTLKNRLYFFAKALKAKGTDVPVNVTEEFAAGN